MNETLCTLIERIEVVNRTCVILFVSVQLIRYIIFEG